MRQSPFQKKGKENYPFLLADTRFLTGPDPRVGIIAASGVPNLLAGQIRLDIRETYSLLEGKPESHSERRLLKYSYQFSFMPELLIQSNRNLGPAHSHWGDLLLTQRRFYRFDGEHEDDWNAKDLDYRNSHYVHHFHPGAGEHIRIPMEQQPSVLAVACFILLSFQYERWRQFAIADPEVLKATMLCCPHVKL